MHFIEIGNSYYCGFDCCIKFEDKAVVIVIVANNTEYTYFLEEKNSFRGSQPLSFFKMSQSVYNQRLIRFVSQITTNYKDFTLTDRSKRILGKFAFLGSFRGSLKLDAISFSHKIIDIHAIEPSSSVEDCDTKSKTLS